VRIRLVTGYDELRRCVDFQRLIWGQPVPAAGG
jgi:hypothetical protein